MPLSLRNGQTFAGYRILRILGSGGMGEVYLAQHPRLPRRDALKILPRDVSANTEYRLRFEREADLASTLWHPSIVGVHDRGECDGQLWITMDYVDGFDAAKLLAKNYPTGMPVSMVIKIVTAVASALDYAHEQDLVHRDVKPANIMVTQGSGRANQRILLADFGIARNISDIDGLTGTNMTVGTVGYAAPKQLMGEPIDGRADQYALAATTYHLLTGSRLFPDSNPVVVISKQLGAAPPALADTIPELGRLDPVLAVALAKDPEDRFASCGDFAQALAARNARRGAASPLPPRPDKPTKSSPKPTTASSKPVGIPRGKANSRKRTAGVAGPHRKSEKHPRSMESKPPIDEYRNNGSLRWLDGDIWLWPLIIGISIMAIGFGILAGLTISGRSERGTAASTVKVTPTGVAPAQTAPPPTMIVPESTASVAQPPSPAIVDVDRSDYENPEYPGIYNFVYARTPYYRDCGIFPIAKKSTDPEGLSCSVSFPPGTPDVDDGSFRGPPNEVKIILPDGPSDGISEGGRQTAKTLLPNHRITVGAFSCTALPEGGVKCEAPTGGFEFVGGVLTKHDPYS